MTSVNEPRCLSQQDVAILLKDKGVKVRISEIGNFISVQILLRNVSGRFLIRRADSERTILRKLHTTIAAITT